MSKQPIKILNPSAPNTLTEPVDASNKPLQVDGAKPRLPKSAIPLPKKVIILPVEKKIAELRKCKTCLKVRNIEDFDKKGTKGYIKTSCIDCDVGTKPRAKQNILEPANKNNISGENLTNKLEEVLVKMTNMTDTSRDVNNKVIEIYAGVEKINKIINEE